METRYLSRSDDGAGRHPPSPRGREIRVPEEVNGVTRPRYVGQYDPTTGTLHTYRHTSKSHLPLPIRELIGGAIWDACEALRAAADAAGVTPEALLAWAQTEAPRLLELFHTGPCGPDTETAHADPDPGPTSG